MLVVFFLHTRQKPRRFLAGIATEEGYVPRSNNLEEWKIVGVAKHDMYYNEGTQYEGCLVYGIEKNGCRILIGEEEIEIFNTGGIYEIE